jgi:ABC-type Na+ efflux pump permease subunit
MSVKEIQMTGSASLSIYRPLIRLLLLAMLGMVAIGRAYDLWPSFCFCCYMVPTVTAMMFCCLWKIYTTFKPNKQVYFTAWFLGAVGIAMNFSVLLANKGMMPANNTTNRVGFHIPFCQAHGLLFLADRIGHTYALSVGDIFTLGGFSVCLFVAGWALVGNG